MKVMQQLGEYLAFNVWNIDDRSNTLQKLQCSNYCYIMQTVSFFHVTLKYSQDYVGQWKVLPSYWKDWVLKSRVTWGKRSWSSFLSKVFFSLCLSLTPNSIFFFLPWTGTCPWGLQCYLAIDEGAQPKLFSNRLCLIGD